MQRSMNLFLSAACGKASGGGGVLSRPNGDHMNGSPRRRATARDAAGRILALALGLLLAPTAVAGQSDVWTVEGQLGGSFFFGNRDQTHFSTRAAIERADSLFESSTEFRFLYGTATDDEGVTAVSARSWGAASQLDFRPESRWQPFVSGSIESSFERRIALRYDTGAGLKMAFRDPDNRRNRIDFSLAVLSERTYARDGELETPEEVSLGRWSSTLRVRWASFDDRLRLDTNNSYRPVFDSFGNFRMSSRNSLSYDLTEVVALSFNTQVSYDSRAEERGADSNYDGRTEVSVIARF